MDNSVEQIRREFYTHLTEIDNVDLIKNVMRIFDEVISSYDVKRKVTELTVSNGIPMVVKAYIAAKIVQNISKGTLEIYTLTLKNFFDTMHKDIDAITTNDVRLYLYHYKESRGVADSTLEQIRSTLKSFFDWCIDEEFCTSNPVKRIGVIKTQNKQRHALSMIDLERMRSACKTLRQKALLDFIYSTGCRVSEVCDAKLSDIDWQTSSMIVRHGKGDKERTVWLNPESQISLKAYLKSRDDEMPFVFVTAHAPHNQIRKKAIEREITRIGELAGVSYVHPHLIRHTTATVALRNGMPIEQVKVMLGHSKIDTTMIYTDIDTTSIAVNHSRFVC